MTKEKKLEIVQGAITDLKINTIEFPNTNWFMCEGLKWSQCDTCDGDSVPNDVPSLFPEFVALGEQYKSNTWHGGWALVKLNGEILDLDYPISIEDRTPIHYQNRLKILEWLYDEVSKS